MQDATSNPRAKDWNHWFYLHRDERPLKSQIAQQLNLHPSYFSKLLDPGRYRPTLDDETVAKIAAMWNQPLSYVRRLYPQRAA